MKQHSFVKFAIALSVFLMPVVFIASCSSGGDGGGGGGPVPPTPTPIGTAARLVAFTTSMLTTTGAPASGTAIGKLAANMDNGEIGGAVLVSGLSSTTLAVGIHDSTAAPATSLIVSLISSTSTTGAWTVPANTKLNQLQLSALGFGGLFFRVDTQSFPNAKRGDIVLPNITITTPLTPVAGTGSTGAGSATMTVNLGTGTISGTITFSGLTSSATEAHIHLRSAPTTSIITLEGGGTTAGTFTFPAGASLNAPQLTALVNDGLYFTINSQNFQLPVSELAGNIVYPVTTIPAVDLHANQEVVVPPDPPVIAPVSSGKGNLTVNLGTGKISGSIIFNTQSSLATVAHIHEGFEGVNGPPIVSLTGGESRTSGTWNVPANRFLTAGELGSLISDGLYLNIHTAANPNGEIRGQIKSVPTN